MSTLVWMADMTSSTIRFERTVAVMTTKCEASLIDALRRDNYHLVRGFGGEFEVSIVNTRA